MERFTSYEWISAVLLCVVACAARLLAEDNKRRETGKAKYRITPWKVFYNASVTFLAGFLTVINLHETELGNGKKMLLTALACFLAPAITDALMLVNGRLLLNEFANWLRTKTNTPAPDSSPPNESEDEADDTENPA